MAEETNNANVTKIDVSVPLEATMGASPSMRNLREKQGLTKSDFSFKIPTQQDACMHVNEEHGRHSWQAKILNVIHTKGFQRFMIGLLLADVLILFTELFLMATFPHCSLVERDAISCCPVDEAHEGRWLASDHHDICEPPTEAVDYPAGCDDHKYGAVHTIETVLFSLTIAILSIMMIELLLLMAGALSYEKAISPCVFFRHLFYILDFFIVGTSLGLEAAFKNIGQDELATYVGLLVLFRCWRFVRISHGLIEVTAELTAEKYEKVVKEAIQLEDLMAKHEAKMAAQGQDDETDSVIEIRTVTKSLADHLLATQDEDADKIHFSGAKKVGKDLFEIVTHHSIHHKSHHGNGAGEEEEEDASKSNGESPITKSDVENHVDHVDSGESENA